MTRTDDEKIITRCSAPMDFEIAIGGFIKKSCSFYGGKMLNFGIKMNGTSASYQIFQSEHIKVSRVDWLLGNKPIKNCDLNQSKSDGNDNRCELNVAEYAGKLECRITGVVAMATLSRYYAGYCVASIELEGSTKNEAAKTVASTKNLLSGPQNQKILTLKTNGTDQIVGRLRWGGPEDAVRNITGGEMFKKWCKIEDLLPRGTYSYRWVLKPLDNGKVPDKPLFDKCNQTKVGANNKRYVFCGSTYADLPMYDEGDIVCRATYIDTLLNDPATVDSDVIYRVKSHPHIQLNLTTSNGGSYLSATCSVSKFEGYSLNWTSVGEQLNNTDIESCGNETHSCTQLRKQFTSNTTVYCQYWSSKFIERKEIAIKINLSGPITTFPTTRPFINERAITSTAAQPTTKEPIPTTTEIPEPIISSTSNSTTKKAELPTETAIPSTTENTTSLSTPTPSPGADTRAAESDIAIIVGILITIFGNVLVCAVAVCYARRRGCLHRGPEEQSQRQISNTRPGASKANPEEPAYSIPHKWLSRPSKKEPAVTYTSLDLMPSASWAGRDDTPYAEIVGVEQPEYAEVHQQPVYSNLMDSEPGCSNVVKYANSNASVANPEAQYAFVLPKSMRKK